MKKPAAFPFSDEPPAVQLSLMPEEIPARDVFQSNTQPAAEDVFQSNTQTAAEDVFHRNTQPAAEDVFHRNTQSAANDVFQSNTQFAAEDVFHRNTQTAAEDVFQPNTQPAAEDVFHRNTQPAAEDVFHRNTQLGRHEFTQAEIDHVLRLGSNTDRHRECIVAAFEKQNPIGGIAADLQTIYHGGNGFSIGAEMFAAWYGRDGVHLSRGRSARYDAGAYLKFIAQIVTGKSPARTCEDVDAAALSYAEIKALSAGDPRIKERMELEVEVNKLNVLRTAYKNEQYHLQDEIRMIPDKLTDKERLLAALQQDGRTFAAHHAESVGDTFRAEISGTVYTQKEDAGNALLQRIESETAKIKAGADDALAWEKSLPIGHYCGFELYLTRDPLQNCILWVRGETKRQVETGMTPQGMMQRLGNALSGIEEHIPDCEKRITLLNEQLKTAKAELDKPWPQEDEYQIKVARLDELNFLLTKEKEQPQQTEITVAEPQMVR